MPIKDLMPIVRPAPPVRCRDRRIGSAWQSRLMCHERLECQFWSSSDGGCARVIAALVIICR